MPTRAPPITASIRRRGPRCRRGLVRPGPITIVTVLKKEKASGKGKSDSLTRQGPGPPRSKMLLGRFWQRQWRLPIAQPSFLARHEGRHSPAAIVAPDERIRLAQTADDPITSDWRDDREAAPDSPQDEMVPDSQPLSPAVQEEDTLSGQSASLAASPAASPRLDRSAVTPTRSVGSERDSNLAPLKLDMDPSQLTPGTPSPLGLGPGRLSAGLGPAPPLIPALSRGRPAPTPRKHPAALHAALPRRPLGHGDRAEKNAQPPRTPGISHRIAA
ncbi:hypothetical protein ZWY2020_003353 [Hordeum vulgare]|nr:hypothetical protein ZWY2020_003353 [Hordeum vulgare]